MGLGLGLGLGFGGGAAFFVFFSVLTPLPFAPSVLRFFERFARGSSSLVCVWGGRDDVTGGGDEATRGGDGER